MSVNFPATIHQIFKVGQNHIYGVNTVILAWKSLNIRSYTVYIYGSGQPYIYVNTIKHVNAWPTLHMLPNLLHVYSLYTTVCLNTPLLIFIFTIHHKHM